MMLGFVEPDRLPGLKQPGTAGDAYSFKRGTDRETDCFVSAALIGDQKIEG